MFVYERVDGLAHPVVSIATIVTCLLILFGAPVLWAIRAVARIRRHGVTGRYTGMARAAKVVASSMSVWIAAALMVSGDMQDPLDIVFGLPAGFTTMLQMNVVAAALAAVVTLLALVTWVRGYWSFLGRIEYTIVALAGLVYSSWMHPWNFSAL